MEMGCKTSRGDHGRHWACGAAIVLATFFSSPGSADVAGAKVGVSRFDCGQGTLPRAFYSDTYAYAGTEKVDGVVSCYLIRHGEDYLLWDTGLSLRYLHPGSGGMPGFELKATLIDELRARGIGPEHIRYVALSHLHFDHMGQAHEFPAATLLVGMQDWAEAKVTHPSEGMDLPGIQPWLAGSAQVRTVDGDLDVFGDGTVIMLATPGHSPGHHSLLVRSTEGPPVLLTGDVWHAEFQRADGTVSQHTRDRAALLASRQRLEAIAKNTGARIVVSHDRSDNTWSELPQP